MSPDERTIAVNRTVSGKGLVAVRAARRPQRFTFDVALYILSDLDAGRPLDRVSSTRIGARSISSRKLASGTGAEELLLDTKESGLERLVPYGRTLLFRRATRRPFTTSWALPLGYAQGVPPRPDPRLPRRDAVSLRRHVDLYPADENRGDSRSTCSRFPPGRNFRSPPTRRTCPLAPGREGDHTGSHDRMMAAPVRLTTMAIRRGRHAVGSGSPPVSAARCRRGSPTVNHYLLVADRCSEFL